MAGPAHPNWRHGRRSKFLPKDLQQAYADALQDQSLADLTEDLALVEVRIGQLAERLSAGGSAETWQKLSEAWGTFLQAVSDDDEDKQRQAIRQLGARIQQGQREETTWAELVSLIDHRRRLAESSQRIAVQARQVVAIDLVLGYLANLVAAVKASVYEHADPATARRIIIDTSTAYRQLLGPGASSDGR